MKKEKNRVQEQWAKAAWDMLYLVQCGINSIVPEPDRIAKMNLEEVYARSKSQSLEALTYMALESLMKSNPKAVISDETQVLSEWKDAKNKAVAKSLMMDVAREQLFAFLEEQGIWHMVLKGAVLCRMYPKYGMRQMADNDILFDPSFRQEVHDWFVQQGYDVESFQETNHDEYYKQPIYNFEMHVSLFSPSAKLPFTEYYLAVKERLLVAPEKVYEYRMTDEDFYLYMVAHDYKHYFYNGTGLRSLADLYVYLRKKDHLCLESLNPQLEKMGLLMFEQEMRQLAQKVFDPGQNADAFTKRERALIKSLLFSQTYGTRRNFWKNYAGQKQNMKAKIPIKTKAIYLLRRFFPDRIYMDMWCQRYAPFLFRHRWLMPLAPICRIIKNGIEVGKKSRKN